MEQYSYSSGYCNGRHDEVDFVGALSLFLFESEDLRRENRTKMKVLFGLVDSYVKIPDFSTAIPIFMNPTVVLL